jgi:TerC family integral membrane protein
MTDAAMLDWTIFALVVAALLIVDFTLARDSRPDGSTRRAWMWSAAWIGVAIAFGGFIFVRHGSEASLAYYTAYVLEKSLSLDNLALFALVFNQTGIVGRMQRKVLMWGVIGALVMRATLIGAGLYVLQKFQWVVYPFAALLLYAAVQMLRAESQRRLWVDTTCTLCSTWIAKIVPVATEQHGDRFIVRVDGKRFATPLLVALVAIESADIVFAVDSIPAVFAVTRDPYLVYTSNIFALLGLRSLFAVVGNLVERFPYVRYALAALLVFVAIKLGASAFLHIPAAASLAIIASILALAAAATLWLPPPRQRMPAIVPCAHRDQERDVNPADTGCTECKKIGDTWTHLRMCQTCGIVGCCDSSKNKHASKHFHATGHPIIRSLEPGEGWKWCYIDNAVIEYESGEPAP